MRTMTQIEEKNRFVLIGTIMLAVSVVFLLYVATSLYYSGKQFQKQTHPVELVCR